MAERRYNLARAHDDAGRPDLAAPLLRKPIAGDPEQGRYYSTLAGCLMQAGDREGCRQMLDSFDEAFSEFAPRASDGIRT